MRDLKDSLPVTEGGVRGSSEIGPRTGQCLEDESDTIRLHTYPLLAPGNSIALADRVLSC